MSNDVIRPGDRYELLIEVTGPVDPNGMVPVQATILSNGLPVWGKIAADVVHSGKRLPRPLKVGDRVTMPETVPVSARIEWTDGTQALLRWGSSGLLDIQDVSDLTPAEEAR